MPDQRETFDTLCAFMFGGPEHMESWECGFVKDHPIHAEGGKEFRHSFVKPKPTVATNRDMMRDDPRVMEAIRCDPSAHVAWIPTLCDEIERLRAARKDDGELIKSLRHRLRSGLPYGDPHACPTSCNTSFCGRGGCRFTNG